jgi:hypothetical protein
MNDQAYIASAVPNGKSQTNRPDEISAAILAQRLLLNSPYEIK